MRTCVLVHAHMLASLCGGRHAFAFAHATEYARMHTHVHVFSYMNAAILHVFLRAHARILRTLLLCTFWHEGTGVPTHSRLLICAHTCTCVEQVHLSTLHVVARAAWGNIHVRMSACFARRHTCALALTPSLAQPHGVQVRACMYGVGACMGVLAHMRALRFVCAHTYLFASTRAFACARMHYTSRRRTHKFGKKPESLTYIRDLRIFKQCSLTPRTCAPAEDTGQHHVGHLDHAP